MTQLALPLQRPFLLPTSSPRLPTRLACDPYVDTEGAQLFGLGQRRGLDATPGPHLVLGVTADPYAPPEAQRLESRALLEGLRMAEGGRIDLTTRSTLVLRDLDLLTTLDERHAVTVRIPIPSLDPSLTEALEPGSAPPDERLSIVARLAEAGLDVVVLVAPLIAALNDGAEELEPLVLAAREAGARDVRGRTLVLPSSRRPAFFAWLSDAHPELVILFKKLYRRRRRLRPSVAEQVRQELERLRFRYGFPRREVGRG